MASAFSSPLSLKALRRKLLPSPAESDCLPAPAAGTAMSGSGARRPLCRPLTFSRSLLSMALSR
uniref:Uncharacterized protein n=1 Tax=Molossus molossus TaxID=27622 RepID=A0A7J8BXK8_MOLMO|nr:hypothetical protein HJG59_001680 [Molossus molossus]